jgi:hypothetical protein
MILPTSTTSPRDDSHVRYWTLFHRESPGKWIGGIIHKRIKQKGRRNSVPSKRQVGGTRPIFCIQI